MLSPVNFASSSASRYVSLYSGPFSTFLPQYCLHSTFLPPRLKCELAETCPTPLGEHDGYRQGGPLLAGKGSSDPETSAEPAVRGVANPGSSLLSPVRVCFHSLRATLRGSRPAVCHQACSLPARWTDRWYERQSGTVNSSLALRPSARGCTNRM